ncbi:MAG TPA: Ig-like domain-containing protein, partial [Thermoanaerobaculia bacterium]|nr:Ig-like domain-containing protein [Thermoanaerobaculia bacterium]
WNGSMMSNAWRDPGWRGAFLLISRLTATDGNCDIPNPPDGTAKSQINPFANTDCTSTFNIGTTTHTTSGSGSLLDDFCARCHMPANYIDNVPLANVTNDPPSGLENGAVDPNFDPTSANGTTLAFTTLSAQHRNTPPGQRGVFCESCHTYTQTRYTPYHNYQRTGTEYTPALGTGGRDGLVSPPDIMNVASATSPNLGYGVGAGSFRVSPHAIGTPERFGPLSWDNYSATLDPYVSDVFNTNINYQQGQFSGKHDGYRQVMFERSEYCSACHDVTNPLTIKNTQGRWVGGFPIERTYTEWRTSRYADRPGNSNFDPNYKRDCQTCHMQQDYGQPGTAQTLSPGGIPVAPLSDSVCSNGPVRPVFFSHHFVGGNAYVTRLVGADVDGSGNVQPYPELSTFSYSSADENSPYHNAVWENVTNRGPASQHYRLAWDRLRNVLDLQLSGPVSASAGTTQPVSVSLTNTGSGHDFPTGFPEGRNAWVAVRAFDLATGTELQIQDSFWNRTATGVGYLTSASQVDPNYPGCNWTIPAGSADPYSAQLKAVASLGNGCPSLDLPYATPLNLVVNAQGQPTDAGGTVIDRNNPLGLPRFTDLDGDGDLYDDSFLVDSRLRPLPHPGATLSLNRYSVVIPAGTAGPVAVTAEVYYQSFEAIVARKFLGNLGDTDSDRTLEPCVLKSSCDGRTPTVEPAVVEGAPPVPMEVRNWVIDITGTTDTTPPAITTYPANAATDVYQDVVVKAHFSEPVTGIDTTTFTLTDSNGLTVPAFVDQIGDRTWALFPHSIFLNTRAVYTAHLAAPICDTNNNCLTQPISWSFTITRTAGAGTGNTSVPLGFPANGGGGGDPAPTVTAVNPANGATNVLTSANVVVTFSEPVTNVNATTFLLNQAGGTGKNCNTLGASIAGTITANGTGSVWTFDPSPTLNTRTLYCVRVTTGVRDLAGQALQAAFNSSFKTAN